MRPFHELWRHLIRDKVEVDDVKGALIYLGFELLALAILVAVMGLLGSLISRLF